MFSKNEKEYALVLASWQDQDQSHRNKIQTKNKATNLKAKATVFKAKTDFLKVKARSYYQGWFFSSQDPTNRGWGYG